MPVGYEDAGGRHYGQCDGCGFGSLEPPDRAFLMSQDNDGVAPWVCVDCYERYHADEHDDCDCEDCERARGRREGREGNDHDGTAASDETTLDGLEEIALPALLVPALPDRPARLVSIEQEVGRGGSWIAAELHREGLSSHDYMRGYHSNPNGERLYVEEDASVAGEVIYSRLRLDEEAEALMVERGVQVVQRGIRTDRVKLDMRCGLHVHVGIGYDDTDSGAPIAAYSLRSIRSLYHLWNHVEDLVFRLASANWRAHRSEVASHDYAPKTAKGAVKTHEVTRSVGFRGALNLGNYLESRHACACGAMQWGVFEECSCSNLPKSTVEFRVFNACANVRKLRAYVALCLALVAYAERVDVSEESHPPLDWTEDTGTMDEEALADRWAFLMRELPLTEEERADLLYCAERCSLAPVLQRRRARRPDGTFAPRRESSGQVALAV